MKTKHTPGQWWIDINREILADPRGDIKIGRIYPISPDNNGSANATLIIAAPQMLITLESAKIALMDALNNLPPESECAQFLRGRLSMIDHTIKEATA